MKPVLTRSTLNSLKSQSFAVFIFVSLVYMALRSKGLDDWDSVQFALGVKKFNLFAHAPHPPGYPLYIFAGKVLVFLGMDVVKALTVVACLGGGLFTAAWFFICSRQFGRAMGWLMAAAIALAPMLWMTATKVLTDAPASAFLAVELAAVMVYRDRRSLRWIVLAAVAGAIGAGLRPQNFGVLLIILIAGLAWARPGRRGWLTGLGVFLAANLLWFIPLLWSQSLLPQAHGSWLAYPKQVLAQWLWRFDKPGNFIGADDGKPGYIWKYAFNHSLRTWFEYGFGWELRFGGFAGLAVYIAGAAAYIRRGRLRADAPFWRFHLIWAVVYFLQVFCFLPVAIRYQLPLLPLLILPAVAGLWSLPGRMRWLAAAVPVMLLLPSAGYIMQNHKELAPPIKAMRYLNRKHPKDERSRITLFMVSSKRHAEWYGPDFKTYDIERAARMNDGILSRSLAVYTDDKNFAYKSKWKNVKLKKLKEFNRSRVIHHKHQTITLYRVTRD